MKTKQCKTCKDTFPLDNNHFYIVKSRNNFYFRNDCKTCFNEEKRYKQKIKKLKEEQAKKDQWQEQYKNKTFICASCKESKTFEEMRKISTDKRVHSYCKKCDYVKSKEIYEPNLQAKIFGQVLDERKKRREINNGN